MPIQFGSLPKELQLFAGHLLQPQKIMVETFTMSSPPSSEFQRRRLLLYSSVSIKVVPSNRQIISCR